MPADDSSLDLGRERVQKGKKNELEESEAAERAGKVKRGRRRWVAARLGWQAGCAWQAGRLHAASRRLHVGESNAHAK